MTTNRTFTGKDVQEATAAALEALGAELEDVDIRVISPGKPGIFGLGGALAEIEVSITGEEAAAEIDVAEESPDFGQDEAEGGRRPSRQRQPRRQQGQRQARPRQRRTGGGRATPRERTRRQSGGRQQRRERTDNAPQRTTTRRSEGQRNREPRDAERQPDQIEPVAREPEPIEELTPEVRKQLEEVTSEVLGRLISNMQVRVDAYVLDDLRDGSLVFEIEGEDAGLLIGRRGDTLRDLQSIVRLLVGRRLQRRPNIIIDVEQYQDRRRNRLQHLAERAARDATRDGEQRLEPMSSDERRLVHLALAEHPNVVTESEGEGDERHVVVKARDD